MSSFNQGRVPRQARDTGHTPSITAIHIGIVKETRDPQRMGRLLVWISDFGPDAEENYVTVAYASPFGGVTPMADVKPDDDTMDGSQKSYGWWATPPDVGNEVLCCFVNGDLTNGYYFACLYPQNMNQMVPGLGSATSTDASLNGQFTPGPPVVEYNKKKQFSATPTSANPTGPDAPVERPVFTPLATGLTTQGLNQDPKRGPSTSSARRESPSKSYGYLSPRGNTIHIDDGVVEGEGAEPQNEFIRFRTRSGTQILIHETEGFIYMISKQGKSWIEISDNGIDMYSAGPISLASDADVNLYAGGSINMHGSTGINMKSAQLTSFTSGSTNFATQGDFLVESLKDTFFIAHNNFGIEATNDIGMVAEHDILQAACGVISRNAMGLLDNSSGGNPEQAKHAQFVMGSVVSRVPRHEPWERGGTSSGGLSGGGAAGPLGDVNGDTPSVPVPEGIAERAKVIYQMLKRLGWSDPQIAGILGSWQQESTLNPNARNSLGAIGLAQWLDRASALRRFASQRNKPWNDLATQIDFFQYEITQVPYERRMAYDRLRAATTARAAVDAMNRYERFGGYQQGERGREAGRRYQYAEQHMQAIQAGRYNEGTTLPNPATSG